MPARRDLLRWGLAGATSGAAPFFVRHARAAGVSRFALGVASGSPRADGMVLWTRLTGADLPPRVDVQWELAHDEAFTKIAARGRETASADYAHTVHAEPAGLAPDRPYFYRFTAAGQRSATGRTRSAPAPGADVARLDFVIASCQRWDHGHWAAWRHAAAEAPDLVLFLGDYIYENETTYAAAVRPHEGGRVDTLAEYRARYAQYRRDPALQAAHAAAPWIVIADDHEVANDYAGLQDPGQARSFPQRRADAYRAWWEHMPLPKALKPEAGVIRMHGRLDWGRLARLHWLDIRQHRDAQPCPRPGRAGSNSVRRNECAALADRGRTLLGAAQERWLAEGWSLERPWNLLAQQTLMARQWRPGRPDTGDEPEVWTDGWDGYAGARARLLGTVAERRVPGAVVLGGDVHATYVAALKPDFDDPRAPVVASEFCGTSISSRGPAQGRVDDALALNPHLLYGRGNRRGYLHFSLQRDRLLVSTRTVRDARDPDSALEAPVRFVVDAARPGPQAA